MELLLIVERDSKSAYKYQNDFQKKVMKKIKRDNVIQCKSGDISAGVLFEVLTFELNSEAEEECSCMKIWGEKNSRERGQQVHML